MKFAIAGLLFVVGFAHGADHFLHGCSSHCTLRVEDRTCWNKTNAFFERVTLSLMRQYVNVQVHRAQFMESKGVKVDYKQMGDETIQRWSKQNPANIEDEDGMTDTKMYRGVVRGLIDTVKGLVEDLEGKHLKRDLLCPQGCEKASKHWMWMFIGSAIITAIITTILITVVCLLDLRDRRMSMLEEAKEMLNK